ncbi:MAG: HutD family protein [Phycisphaerae bacterium]|nr:HutD family protein [Phycisphaerae bacterium]
MPLTLLPPNAATRMPWKNGRGSTLELASDARAGQPWTWRVSIADVPESGPFSIFDGCDREIACLEGDGMRLVVDGVPHDVPHEGRACAFSGNAETSGVLLGGPCRDANLMWRRDAWQGGLVLYRGACTFEGAADVSVVHVVRGAATVNGRSLAQGMSAIATGEKLHVAGDGLVMVAELKKKVEKGEWRGA